MRDIETEALPIVEPDQRAVTGSPAVVGIVLAAGSSQRFGDANKLCAELNGTPIVRQSVETFSESTVSDTVVVLGHEADRVGTLLSGLAVETIVNDEYTKGQATSVRAGVRAVCERFPAVDAIVIGLGDMPFVSVRTIDQLIQVSATSEWRALAPIVDGIRGNPVLFDRTHFPALTDVSGDIGGQEILLEGKQSAFVSVTDTGIHRDIDRPSDF